MIDNLTKYAGIIPIVAIVVYLLGYISLETYLYSYGIDENIGLDFSVLRHGMLLSVIIGPIVALCFADFKSGNYDNVDPGKSETLIHNLHDAMGYTILYTIPLGFVFYGRDMDSSTWIMISVLFVSLLLNKIRVKPDVAKALKGMFLLCPMVLFCILTITFPITGKVALYTLQMLIFFGCSCLRIYNKDHQTYQSSKIGSVVLAVVSGAALFGSYLVTDIPARYGGELRTQTRYYLNADKFKEIQNDEICKTVGSDRSISLRKVYQTTDNFYFLIEKKFVFSLPADYFEVTQSTIPRGFIQSPVSAK